MSGLLVLFAAPFFLAGLWMLIVTRSANYRARFSKLRVQLAAFMLMLPALVAVSVGVLDGWGIFATDTTRTLNVTGFFFLIGMVPLAFIVAVSRRSEPDRVDRRALELPQMLTIGHAASYLRVSEADVRDFIDKGILRAAPLGLDLYIDRDDLIAFLEGRGVVSVATDSSVLVRSLKRLELHLDVLRPLYAIPLEVYRHDQAAQAAVQGGLRAATQVCLEIANHLAVRNGHPVPEDRARVFDLLAQQDIVTSGLAEHMTRLARLRQELAADDMPVDSITVYWHLNRGLAHFDAFARLIFERYVIDESMMERAEYLAPGADGA